MKKPKTPIYNPEDLKALLLGECPLLWRKSDRHAKPEEGIHLIA